MGQPYDVDVIILSWDRIEDTIAAVASALEQEGVSQRVIVVDQGSQPENLDKLLDYLSREPPVVLELLERNVGVPAGRNIASSLGSARYIVALDSDAVFADRTMLAKAVRHLDAEPELCAIGFRILNYFTGENDDTSWDYPEAYKAHADEDFYTSRFIGAGHAIRRAAFQAAGGYDDDLFFCGEELDLSYRMLDLGYRMKYVRDVAILHKVSPERRLAWNSLRYYYSARNHLYIQFKYGRPLHKIVLSAAGFAAKGAYNGVMGQSLKAIGDAGRMCAAYSIAQRKSRYHLHEEVHRYILECELRPRRTVRQRLNKIFSRLPGHA